MTENKTGIKKGTMTENKTGIKKVIAMALTKSSH